MKFQTESSTRRPVWVLKSRRETFATIVALQPVSMSSVNLSRCQGRVLVLLR